MRRFGLFLMTVCTVALVSQASYAGARKESSWLNRPTHWKNLNYEPYLGNNKITQRGLWEKDDWTPEDWAKDAGSPQRIIKDFYMGDIIREQYNDENNVPVLVVGDGFMRLSGLDRRRVLSFVDYAFDITASEENGMFYVFSAEDMKEPIGIYNKYGFQQS